MTSCVYLSLKAMHRMLYFYQTNKGTGIASLPNDKNNMTRGIPRERCEDVKMSNH